MNPAFFSFQYTQSRQTESLAGQQACLEGEDAYSKKSGEPEVDSTADGEVRVTQILLRPTGKQVYINFQAW